VRSGQGTLTVAPGNFLDKDRLAAAAIDAPHGVEQKDQKSPEGNELESPLGELVVTRCRLMAAQTDRRRPFARTHGNLNIFVIGAEAGLLVNKTRKVMTVVWNRDELEHEVKTVEGENYQDKPRSRRATSRS
jgi:hypothetical protein